MDTSALAQQVDDCAGVDRSNIWRPAQRATWDLQFASPIDTSAQVDVYDLDAHDSSAQLIERLHQRGSKVVCYVNVGAYEPWRPDARLYPQSVLGNPWSATAYADEKWLDVRQIDLLRPLIAARFDMAKKKGCDAIDADNLDGYDDPTNPRRDRTGFNHTYEDQLRFNRFIACEAHKRGMSIGLKNDSAQANELEPDFDFVISEQCFEWKECGHYQAFLDNGKAVLETEYLEDLGQGAEVKFDALCPEAAQRGISAILKKNKLDSWRHACPDERASAAAAARAGSVAR